AARRTSTEYNCVDPKLNEMRNHGGPKKYTWALLPDHKFVLLRCNLAREFIAFSLSAGSVSLFFVSSVFPLPPSRIPIIWTSKNIGIKNWDLLFTCNF